MALNTSHSPDGRGVVIYNGEMILVYTKEVNLEFEHAPANAPAFKGKKKGPLYLTSHRVIFVSKDQRDGLMSFAMPFHCLRGVKLEQPVFGANYLKGTCLAQPGGNWEGEVVFKLTFMQGGCIDFGKAMLHAHELAARFHMYAAPPPYVPPAGGYFQAPPQYYAPPAGANYCGFQAPTQAFPDQPPAGNVYMYETPPPYTGIGPTPPPYPGPPLASAPSTNGETQQKPPTYDEAIRQKA